MPPRRRKRLDPALFHLPVERIREGVYSDRYFVQSREILIADRRSPRVTMQVSCKNGGYLGGIDEAVAVLKLCADDWSALTVHALYEGDRLEPWETVMTIEGPYETFAHLETLCLGVLARRTRVMTGTRAAVEAARPKPVFYFPARLDHWLMQPGDGFVAAVAGATSVSTEAQASYGVGTPMGTVPHALIAAYGGDTVLATRRYAELLPGDVRVIALVDYENDSVGTSLAVARALEGRLWGVRLDTSEYVVDQSIIPAMGAFRPTGVNAQLVWNVRNALDAEGFGDVKIVASGGFTVERIRAFEDDGVPVDAYGVGEALLAAHADFTGDIVQLDGRPQSRVGRSARANPRLEKVK
jgi:nicotinate phosphoribosyltransferase